MSESKRKVTSFRLTTLATRQLAALTDKLEMNQSEIVSAALDRMYQQECRIMPKYSRRQHLIEAIAERISHYINDDELINLRNDAGWTVDVRWRDGEYISDNDWTRVSGIHLDPDELEQAKQLATQ